MKIELRGSQGRMEARGVSGLMGRIASHDLPKDPIKDPCWYKSVLEPSNLGVLP